MADGVRFILDKLAALFRRLEDTELFSHVMKPHLLNAVFFIGNLLNASL